MVFFHMEEKWIPASAGMTHMVDRLSVKSSPICQKQIARSLNFQYIWLAQGVTPRIA
jgi:hypothetical protein